MYTVYVLLNEQSNIYIGQTEDLIKRLDQHNDPNFDILSYTKLHHGPWKMIYQEDYNSRHEDLMREKQLKSHKGRDWL